MSPDDRRALIEVARRAIAGALLGQDAAPSAPRGAGPPLFQKDRGAFVSLFLAGKLRGCIGEVTACGPLWETVWRMAVAAATRDPRFAPLATEDLPAAAIEISVLGHPVRLADPLAQLELGRHGVVVRNDGKSGVYLPKVAVGQGWSVEELLRQAALKAGLDGEAWRGAEVLGFEAEVLRG